MKNALKQERVADQQEQAGGKGLQETIKLFMRSMLGSLRDLSPIVLVIAFFQLFVLQQIPEGILEIFIGLVFVVLGLTFFIFGLEQGLFPIGESLAHALARKGSVFWLLTFSFLLGFGTTVAEPALTALQTFLIFPDPNGMYAHCMINYF